MLVRPHFKMKHNEVLSVSVAEYALLFLDFNSQTHQQHAFKDETKRNHLFFYENGYFLEHSF